jgi:hypothetical protein
MQPGVAMNQSEYEPESLTTPGIAAAFATAILVVIALTAVPLGQVDKLLHLAVQFFAWSAAFLGGCLVLNVAALADRRRGILVLGRCVSVGAF